MLTKSVTTAHQHETQADANKAPEQNNDIAWGVVLASPYQEHLIYAEGQAVMPPSLDDKAENRIGAASLSTSPEEVLSFIATTRSDLSSSFATFVAVDNVRSGGISPFHGHVHCQRWSGPVPLVVKEQAFKLGSVWGLQASSTDVAAALLSAAKEYLRGIGCQSALAIMTDGRECSRAAYEACGFSPGNMLSLALPSQSQTSTHAVPDHVEGVTVQSEGAEVDSVVADHWNRMWKECGVPPEMMEEDLEQRTLDFIRRARDGQLNYTTMVARATKDGAVIGTASCQLWRGPAPTSAASHGNKIGTVWAVYVKPEYRRRGVGRVLMQNVVSHWKRSGCAHGILIHASQEGRRVYERLGFSPQNCVVSPLVDQGPSKDTVTEKRDQESGERNPGSIDSPTDEMVSGLRSRHGFTDLGEAQLKAFLRALPTQLQAVFGNKCNEGKNMIMAVQEIQKHHGVLDTLSGETNSWLEQNAKRMGRGFDMQKLATDPVRLAAKFDRLAQRYDHWHIGNKSQVERWVASRASAAVETLGGEKMAILDVACGIGLQGGVLRLCGYSGHMTGLDISPGMISRALAREVYDQTHVIDINASGGLKNVLGENSVDLVICTGAMELLNHTHVLSEFARVIKPGGQLWTSMQWEGAIGMDGKVMPNPTRHQNVRGVTRQVALQELDTAGFQVEETSGVEECHCAFRTPSPVGDGTFLPVPYLFIVAQRK